MLNVKDKRNALEWVALVVARPIDEVQTLGLNDEQLERLSWWLFENPRVRLLGTPPAPREKVARFYCKCGCGQWVQRAYKTRRPQYKNDKHKQHAYRTRQRKNGRAMSLALQGV